MEPSKITITNLRDDESKISFEAEYITPNEIITGLLTSAAVINRRCGLDLGDFLKIAARCYIGSNDGEYQEEVMPSDR